MTKLGCCDTEPLEEADMMTWARLTDDLCEFWMEGTDQTDQIRPRSGSGSGSMVCVTSTVD